MCVVKFIQNVYIPMLFRIKCYPEWIYGSDHIYNMLMFTQCLSKETFTVVKDRIQFNSYFAHTENVLLCMICDENEDVRRTAYKIIISTGREHNQRPAHVRVYKKPTIIIEFMSTKSNEIYTHYSDLINWKDEIVHEPPFTQRLTIAELKQHMEDSISGHIIDIPPIPAHSQYTEYYVQVVKNTVTKYMGHEAQDGRIKGKLVARNLNSTFNYKSHTKSGYQLLDKKIS